MRKGIFMQDQYSFTTSTELMGNFKQVELLEQEKHFNVVQTHDGHSIFVGISSDNQIHIILEQSGSSHEWTQTRLTEALPGEVKSFAVSQDFTNGNINLAVAMTDPSGADTLWVLLNQSFKDLSWINPSPAWVTITDDRSAPQNPKLVIADIHLARFSSASDTIIVDTLNNSNMIERYWINKRGTPFWNKHALQFDLDAVASNRNRVGQKSGDLVNGIYTMGSVGNQIQFVFTPVYNAFNPSIAPTPTNFNLANTALNASNSRYDTSPALSGEANATDLFLAGGGHLYYLPANHQDQMAEPLGIYANELLNDVRDFRVSVTAKKVVIWVLNAEDQLFYLSCPIGKIHIPSNWSTPLPLKSSVSKMAEFISVRDGGITVFANVGNGKVLKGIQDPNSTRWTFSAIELPALSDDVKPIKQLSYTTHIQVHDENNNLTRDADVILTPNARVNVFINNVYYALDGSSLTVKTDSTGSVTIVEWIDDSLQGTNFNVHLGNPSAAKALHPMSQPMEKLSQLTTAADLTKAQIIAGDGSKSPLISNASSTQKKALAAAITDLNTAHKGMHAPRVITGPHAGLVSANAIAAPATPVDYIEAFWGDLVEAVESFGEYVIELVKDTAQDAWHFIVKVAGKVYGFFVDTIEKIAGALKVIWNKIVKGWHKFVDWVTFVFEWKDMVHTKDVFKKTILIFFNKMAEDVQKARSAIDTAIDAGETAIRTWAGEDQPNLDSLNTPTNKLAKGKKPPAETHSAPAQFIQSHFKNNVNRSNTTLPPPKVGADPDWSGLTDMSEFLDREKADIAALRNHIKGLFVQAATESHPDIETILKKIIADIAVMAMDLFKGLADKVLDFITLVIEDIANLLDSPIHIPILSDILEDEFGMTLPSVLEILCYVAAIPTTIVYKAVKGKAPYSTDDTLYKNLSDAQSYEDLKRLYNTTDDLITLDKSAEAVLFETTYFASGLCTIINGFLTVLDEETEDSTSSTFATPKAILSVLASGSVGIGSLFNLPMGIKNSEMKTFGTVVSTLNIAQKVTFLLAPTAIAKIKGISGEGPVKALGQQVSKVSKGVSAVLAFIALIPAGYHIVEIIIDGDALTKDGVLGIEDATQSITSKLSTIVGAAALVDTEEITKQILILVQGILIGATGAIQIDEAALEAIA